MAAAVTRWSSHRHLLSLCRNLSASSSGKRDQAGGLPSFSGLKNTLSEPKSQAKQAEVEVEVIEGKPKPKAVTSSSFFDDVRASLRKPSQATPNVAFEEIRKNLSEFRTKSAPPAGGEGKERLSFEMIRDSLRQLRSSSPVKSNGNESVGSFSLKAFGESLRLQPGQGQGPAAGPGPSSSKSFDLSLPSSRQSPRPPKTEFMKMYSYEELGVKLRKLRPQGEKRFSLTELNDRLQKLREMEDKESESNIGGLSFKDLRESLYQLRMSSEATNKKSSLQRLALLGQLGGQPTPSYMISPPKDELVQRYFHPDNMSSKEKLKLELKKVKEDFKIHEADCGSSRVQVAQLTTKIKYLSQVLQKKDKHSRKGLHEMIQKRKKLLKYLRRTDWDSYFFVISKLGLRDNPDYKT